MVAFSLNVSLESEDLGLSAADLLAEGSDLDLHIVVRTTLIIQMEPSIVTFLLKAMQRNTV